MEFPGSADSVICPGFRGVVVLESGGVGGGVVKAKLESVELGRSLWGPGGPANAGAFLVGASGRVNASVVQESLVRLCRTRTAARWNGQLCVTAAGRRASGGVGR